MSGSGISLRLKTAFAGVLRGVATVLCVGTCIGLLGCIADAAQSESQVQQGLLVTNLAQLRQTGRLLLSQGCSLCVTGLVYDAEPTGGKLVLRDDSGFEAVDLGCVPEFIRPGQRVVLNAASCWVTNLEAGYLSVSSGSETRNGTLSLSVLGSERIGEPVPITANEVAAVEEFQHWRELAGTVTFASAELGGLQMEVRSRAARFRVLVANGTGLPPDLLLNSQIRAVGFCRSLFTSDGRKKLSEMVVLDWRNVHLIAVTANTWEAHPVLPIKALAAMEPGSSGSVVHLAGRVLAVTPGGLVRLEDSSGEVEAAGLQTALLKEGDEVELLGTWYRAGTNAELRAAVCRTVQPPFAGSVMGQPVLTNIDQVKRLKREEAQRGFPVRLRGVVTSVRPEFRAAVIQDGTRGIYVATFDSTPGSTNQSSIWNATPQPRRGDYWEIEGISDPGEFAPLVKCQRATWLGEGGLPEPLRPSWDQLANGSMDVEYVEVQGMVTGLAAAGDRIVLLTRGGRLTVDLPNAPDTLRQCENARVTLRGCLFASWDIATHRVREGKVAFYDYALSVDEPAPLDPFAAPLKGAGDFRLFDLEANVLQRVRVRGQVIHAAGTDHRLMDGAAGLRFVARRPEQLHAGDWVEVVGFPQPGAPSPVLSEALVRKTGHGPLPQPKALGADELIGEDHDSTLVQIEGLLVEKRYEQDELVLKMQAGLQVFPARLSGGTSLKSLAPGSLLLLTGAYVIPDVKRAGGSVSPFELLLDSPSAIHVLARPPFWTLRRTLAVLQVMAVVLALSVLWVATLRRRVKSQTGVIRRQIEHQATLEERSRIAREFHDTLEQALAGVGMQLSALAGMLAQAPTEARRILEVALAMVRHSQEEARRSVRNLRTLALEQADLPSALAQTAAQLREGYAGEIHFQARGTPRRLPIGIETHLLRLGQEAAHNAVKHAAAKQITIELEFASDVLQLQVADDGHGFDPRRMATNAASHFGLLGMRERADKLGGTLLIRSNLGAGTTIQFTLPLAGIRPAV